MPHKAMTHAEARLSCCAGCGIGRVKLVVKPAIEILIKSMLTLKVESYPLGICGGCRNALYSCKKADEKNESVEQKVRAQWSQFQLQEIKVPRTNGNSAQCPCLICYCAR